jgi:hypothetical protein
MVVSAVDANHRNHCFPFTVHSPAGEIHRLGFLRVFFSSPFYAAIFAHQRSGALMQVKVLTDSQPRMKMKTV